MEKCIKRYPEAYAQLPDRFVKKIELDLNYILQQKIPGLCRIYLFGSVARGEVRSTSDIDLLVVTKTKLQNRELAADIRWTLDEAVDGVRTDVVYKNESSSQPDSVFERELSRDKKLILEVGE